MPPRKLSRIASLVFFPMALFAEPAFPDPLEFSEVWAYLMKGEEAFLDLGYPISDIAYFGAGLDIAGRLAGAPDRGALSAFPGRVHLVVAETGNYALTHFCLDPGFPLRDALVADIARAAESFDGVQVDFEAIGSGDYENYLSFLGLLKRSLGAKILSVAVPARFEEKQDRLGYERVGQAVDRVVVMAYDEHWSASEPGPVASLEWCGKVAAYAASKVEEGKLVMGAPFYGRAWADKALSRAYKHSGVASLLAEKGIGEAQRPEGIPFVEYSESVNVKVYFDDAESVARRLGLYRDASVRNVAFWRLGQEDAEVWKRIALSPRGGEPPPPAGD
jgi:spore germination protein